MTNHPSRIPNLTRTTHTGFFSPYDDEPGIDDLLFVAWNAGGTSRYVASMEPAPARNGDTITLPRIFPEMASVIELVPLGSAPLRSLTPAQRVPTAKALRLIARNGPWGLCMHCHRSLTRRRTHPAEALFGTCFRCMDAKLQLGKYAAEAIYTTYITVGIEQMCEELNG